MREGLQTAGEVVTPAWHQGNELKSEISKNGIGLGTVYLSLR